MPLAYGTGLVISLIIGLFLPSVFSSKVKESINFKYVKFCSWIFAALAGVLSGNLISSSVSKLSRASARNVDVTAPAWMRGQVEILGTAFPKTRLMIIIITLISVIAITLFLNQSAWGMRIRAVTQNREMSDCLGISTEKVDVLTFGIGSGLAGVAGVAVSLLGSVGPNVGGNYIVGCFMVVVLGV